MENMELEHRIMQVKDIVHVHARCLYRKLPEFLKTRIDYDDLVSEGMLAAVETSQRFNPTMGAKFSSYAYQRIEGAIKDCIRKTLGITRTVEDGLRKLREIKESFLIRRGHEPTDEELSEASGFSVKKIQELRQLEITLVSLEEELDKGGNVQYPPVLVDTVDPEKELTRDQLLRDLTCCLDSITPQQRLVIELHYLEGYPLTKIGSILGLSKDQVWRKSNKAIKAMWGYLESRGWEMKDIEVV